MKNIKYCVVQTRWWVGTSKGTKVQRLLLGNGRQTHQKYPGISLGNCSVNELPRQRIRMQRSRYCWTITLEKVFSVWFVPRCYRQGCCSPTFALLIICCLATGPCLPSRCPETVPVYPPISHLFLNSGCTSYNIILKLLERQQSWLF
jgi:hypothetical protein